MQHAEPSAYAPVGNDAKLTIFRHGKGVKYAVAMTVEWQQKVYTYGASILGVDAITYLLAVVRSPHIDPTGNEFFFYFFGGGSLCFIALLLLCVGRGRGRLLLVLIDLIGLYLWFAYVTFQAMLH